MTTSAEGAPLSDVSVEIKKGKVIGPSGTGKSTLLRCLNLLEAPVRMVLGLTKEHPWRGDKGNRITLIL